MDLKFTDADNKNFRIYYPKRDLGNLAMGMIATASVDLDSTDSSNYSVLTHVIIDMSASSTACLGMRILRSARPRSDFGPGP